MISKRVVTVILSVVMLMGLVGFVACNDGDRGGQSADMSDYALVGIWEWDDNTLWMYNFAPDGTGSRGLPDDYQTFTWSIQDDGHVRINTQGYGREDWDYILDGDRLMLESRQFAGMSKAFTREGAMREISLDLIGVWNWDINPLWQYTFHTDGTGYRGAQDRLEHFVWTTPEPGHVQINAEGIWENWDYEVRGDGLILESREFAGEVYTYRRDGVPVGIDLDLVGIWAWENDPDWRYDFFLDGDGTRGTPDDRMTLTWTTPEEGLLWIGVGGFMEDWEYTLIRDRLTMQSIQDENVIYTFIRVSE